MGPGVTWREAAGWVRPARGRAVVLATGSVLSNEARAARLSAESVCPLDARVTGKDGVLPSDADALGFLVPLGVATRDLDAVGAYPHVLPLGADFHFLDVARAIWVDAEGRRFFDECEWASVHAAVAVRRLPGCTAWAIFSESDADAVLAHVPPEKRTTGLDEGRVLFRRESIGSLAAALGADPTLFEASLAEAARPPGQSAGSLVQPLWAARLALTAGKSFGGVVTDLDGCVLDQHDRPVPGLFAAGEFAGMGGGAMGAPDGFDGSLSAVIWSGRRAGRSAAGPSRKR